MVELVEYTENKKARAVKLISDFWKEHNGILVTIEEACKDLEVYTSKGHCFYFIYEDDKPIGYVHLGSRGAEMDWLEDIYVMSEYQNRGIGSQAIALVEEIVRHYSDSLYIEAAARNKQAILLYHRLGFDCLNTITVRKDFRENMHVCVREEDVWDQPFEIREKKKIDWDF